ncbi:cytochrome P450 [Aspergillus pseudonomiae]|nr:cytochrome P450 [Aspergillus pseudonomiae]
MPRILPHLWTLAEAGQDSGLRNGCVLLPVLIRAVIPTLRSVPGPFLARFSRLWYFIQVYRGRFPWSNIELHRKYGAIVRIAPNEYSIDDPTAVKTLYGPGTSFIKGPWYDGSHNIGDEKVGIFAVRDPKAHHTEKRKIASLYSMSSVVKMEAAVNGCLELLTEKLQEISRYGTSFRLKTLLGRRFGFLDAGKDPIDLVHAIDDVLTYAARVGVYPELHYTFSKLRSISGPSGLSRATAFAARQIQEYKTKLTSSDDLLKSDAMLPQLLRLHDQKPDVVSEGDIIRTCAMNVVAGSDTTSISLTGILWALMKNPTAMTKLRAEVDELYESGNVSDPVSFAEAGRMPYLQAVIKEGIRLHPATGLPLSRVVPKGGATIAGRYFPEGTVIGINPWVAHHNKSVFGEDADEFRPERWLVSAEEGQAMDRYWLPFGHGSRTCIGKNISLLEMSKLIPRIIRRFDFELANPHMKLETSNVWFVKQTNVQIRLRERKH